jgi:lipopolysaccharide biosynthesis glycosyltransferase
MRPLRVFVGWDSREPIAFAVLAHSILRRASVPVSITPLVQASLRACGLYTRERGPTESTEFSLTRFLVPALADYQGLAIYMDCDMLCLGDLADLAARAQDNLGAAVSVVQHDYVPRFARKMDDRAQTMYPRKNWSSLMVFDCSHFATRRLTPAYVNTATGLELHRLLWAGDRVGALPFAWNCLVDEDGQAPEPTLIHYTNGGPWLPEYRGCSSAERWHEEQAAMQGRLADVLQVQSLSAP